MKVYFKNGVPLPAEYAVALEGSLFMQAVSSCPEGDNPILTKLLLDTTQHALRTVLAPFVDKFLKINKVEIRGTDTVLDIEVINMPSKEFDTFYMAYCLAKISNLNPMVNTSASGWDMVLDLVVQLQQNRGIVLRFSMLSFVLLDRLLCLTTDRDVAGLYSAYLESVHRLLEVSNRIKEIPASLGQEYVSLFERVFEDTGGYIDARGKCVPQINGVEFTHLVESYRLPTRRDHNEILKLYKLYASYITGKAGRSPATHADVHSTNLFVTRTYRFK